MIPPYHQRSAMEIARTAAVNIDAGMPALEQEIAGGNWQEIEHRARRLDRELMQLQFSGVGMPLPWEPEAGRDTTAFTAAIVAMRQVEEAAARHDRQGLDRHMKELQEEYARLKEKGAATQGR
jgi:ribosomal protein L29